MSEIEELIDDILEYARLLYLHRYIVATEGNLSARMSGNRILITPANANKGRLKRDELVVTDMKGKVLDGNRRASSEIKLHLGIYERRKEIRAICHAHPVYATAFSVAGRGLDQAVLPEIVGTLGAIPLVEYAPPGSAQLAENLGRYVDRYDAFLLQSHGVVAIGKTCEEAFNRLETVERFACILYIAERIGRPRLLGRDETARLLQAAQRDGILGELISGDE